MKKEFFSEKSKLYIDKKYSKNYVGIENPYYMDLINEILIGLDMLDPENFKDRMINNHLYSQVFCLLTYAKEDKLLKTKLGYYKTTIIAGYRTNKNLGKTIIEHKNLKVFNI